MIYLYSGTPGSGKSLHACKNIYYRLKQKKNASVIANFNIKSKKIKNKRGFKFTFVDNNNLNVNFLVEYAQKNHKKNLESQTLLVVDEAQVMWNSRDWQNNKDRLNWIKFFSQHRKLGYDIILICQQDRMLDRQIRSNIEYNIIHRKVNNFKIFNILPFSLFVAVKYWYNLSEKIGSEFFKYNKKYGNLYDTFSIFN